MRTDVVHMTIREEVEKLEKLARPYPVQRLYKYRSMKSQGLQDIFEKRKVFLSDPTKFNDPFECRPHLILGGNPAERKEYLKRLAKDKLPNANRKERRKQIQEKRPLFTNQKYLRNAYNSVMATIGMYCLSEKNDDLLMWSHYSDGHKGLCLEFEASTAGGLFWEAFAVIYQQDYPIVDMMRIGKAEHYRRALLTKSTQWAYEKEWRVIKMESEGGPGHYPFSPGALTGVVFGALMSHTDQQTVKSWIKVYPSKIAIYQATLNGHSYQLDIQRAPEA